MKGLQSIAIKTKRHIASHAFIPLNLEHASDQRALPVQREIERDLRDEPIRRPIVLAANGDVGRGKRCFRSDFGVRHGSNIGHRADLGSGSQACNA